MEQETLLSPLSPFHMSPVHSSLVYFQPRAQTSFQVVEYCSYVVLHVIFDSLPPSTSPTFPTRIDVLCRQKEQQIDELVRLGDEREAAEQHTEILREKVEQINTRTCQLVHR